MARRCKDAIIALLFLNFTPLFPISAPAIPDLCPPPFPISTPVIPAKAGIQRVGDAVRAPSPNGWERGRPARRAALARGDTLTLALSRKGRGDPLVGICT